MQEADINDGDDAAGGDDDAVGVDDDAAGGDDDTAIVKFSMYAQSACNTISHALDMEYS